MHLILLAAQKPHVETKSWISSYINILLCYIHHNALRSHAFQIGTFGTEVTTRPVWSGKRDHALLLTMYNTGGRVSEIIALRREHLHLDPAAGAHLELLGKGYGVRISAERLSLGPEL